MKHHCFRIAILTRRGSLRFKFGVGVIKMYEADKEYMYETQRTIDWKEKTNNNVPREQDNSVDQDFI